MREITETQRKGFPKDITIKGVGAAVCVLVQSLDDELLLTRRSKVNLVRPKLNNSF